jgi:hypothetical protein
MRLARKFFGLILIFSAIYVWASFTYPEYSLPNPLKDICGFFGRWADFVCMYTGAINWFLVALIGGPGYALLVYKNKSTPQPCNKII